MNKENDGLVHLDDLSFDFEDYFERHSSGKLSGEEQMDFSARIYGMFCRDVFFPKGDVQAIKPWVARYIADKLLFALGGMSWNDVMDLPWDEKTEYLTPKGARAFDIYAGVENTLKESPDANTTDLIAEKAREHNVSYETARADYYATKKWITEKTGIPSKFLINGGKF